MSAPRILALDLSLTAAGVCRDGACRVVKTKAKGACRLAMIEGDLTADIRGADVVVLEGYSYASAYQAHQVGELGGVIRVCIWSHGVPCVEVPPATLKKFATGKGNATKDAMISAAIQRFGYTGCDNNEADAYLLWCMARHAYGEPVADVPKVQAATVDVVTWPAAGTGETLADSPETASLVLIGATSATRQNSGKRRAK